ncbi:MAG: tryptophan-rich sensory protein [Candidatus Pacebacteria bacterium]|nr:tryptophan-rich sensory protein [Candidatus Paceibacterota bacterium]
MKLIISLLTPLLIGFVGSLTTTSSVQSWYPTLTKPPLTPPSWVFAPVWTSLYLMMGFSLYLLWSRHRTQKNQKLLYLFLGQLGLNAIWSPVFFGLKLPSLGLIIIAALWISLLTLIIKAWKQHRLAAALLIPYLLWVSFASYLNLAIVWLN